MTGEDRCFCCNQSDIPSCQETTDNEETTNRQLSFKSRIQIISWKLHFYCCTFGFLSVSITNKNNNIEQDYQGHKMNMKDSFTTHSSFKKLNKSFTCIMGRSARRVFQHKIFCELRVERCEGETRARLCMSRGERSAGKLAGSAVSVCIFVNICMLSYFCTYLYIFVFLFTEFVNRFYRIAHLKYFFW